jgi:hypothetical protein
LAKIKVIVGDATQQNPDAVLMTLANPKGVWQGAVDKAIRANLGGEFHSQLRRKWEAGSLSAPGDTVLTESEGRKILFVCDDLDDLRPLPIVVLPGLNFIWEQGIKSVVVPVFRTGPAFWHLQGYEPELADREFIASLLSCQHPLEITVVVYKDVTQAEYLQALITSM